jgi:hypothetical protein
METIIEWMPRVGAVLMLLLGLVGFFKPKLFTAGMGIEMTKPDAWSEIRGVFGGLNLGLALGALLLNSPEVYMTLGLGWTMVFVARVYSIAVDGMTFKTTLPAFVIDGGLAVLFLSGLLF